MIDLLETMADGRLPGIAGFAGAEAGLPLRLRAEPADVSLRHALVLARGLDGQHAALVLASPGTPETPEGG